MASPLADMISGFGAAAGRMSGPDLSGFVSNGGFGMGSYNRAKQAGYSDLDIYNFLGGFRGTIGDQVRQNMSSFNQSQAQAQQGLGLQSYNRAIASGQTPQQFFDYAKNSGLTIGEGLQAEMDKYNASLQPKQLSDADSLKQALRIAGSDGNIGNKELMKITNQFDVGADKAVRQLDQLNAGLKNRGSKLKIGLGSNAVNNIIKNQPSGWAFDQMMGKSTYGGGRIGQAVTNYRNASYNNFQLSNPTDRSIAQSAAGLIPLQRGGAYQVNSAGGYSPKNSNKAFQSQMPVMSQYSYTPGGDTTGATGGTDTPGTTDTPVVTNQPEATTTGGPGMMAGGGTGAAGANRLGRAKSRLKKLGITGSTANQMGRSNVYKNLINMF